MANSTAAPHAVCVDRAQKSFGRRLWTDVSFEVQCGQLVTLAGTSGSGKTTLLNCIGLLETFDAGQLSYGGREVTRASGPTRRRLYRDWVGFLFQNSGLVDNWTVRENLQIALHSRRTSRADRARRIEEALDRVGLAGYADDRVHTLSGGEQQRAGLARLLLKEPRIVLADEPTASLDHRNADIVITALRSLADHGAAVIVSTHDDDVIAASDGVVRLVGRSREAGSRAHVDWRDDVGPRDRSDVAATTG